MKITVELLKQHDACSEQVELFRKLFPGGTAVTLAALKKAVKWGLELSWFAQEFLSVEGFAAYEAAEATAYAAYQAAEAPALKAYRAATAPAKAAYLDARAPALKAYRAALAQAEAAYQAAIAQALWKAWKKEKA